MTGIRDITRLMRLRKTEGMPIHLIIEERLVIKSDWVTFCGATYHDQSAKWVKDRHGSMHYKGPAPRHGG